MNVDWEKRKKYESNRKVLKTSLNINEQETFLLKYGDFPNSVQLKDMLLTGTFKITKRVTISDLPILINNISRIGNNINQVVHLANSKKQLDQVSLLQELLLEIKNELNTFVNENKIN